jgi:hypothetical protein
MNVKKSSSLSYERNSLVCAGKWVISGTPKKFIKQLTEFILD